MKMTFEDSIAFNDFREKYKPTVTVVYECILFDNLGKILHTKLLSTDYEIPKNYDLGSQWDIWSKNEIELLNDYLKVLMNDRVISEFQDINILINEKLVDDIKISAYGDGYFQLSLNMESRVPYIFKRSEIFTDFGWYNKPPKFIVFHDENTNKEMLKLVNPNPPSNKDYIKMMLEGKVAKSIYNFSTSVVKLDIKSEIENIVYRSYTDDNEYFITFNYLTFEYLGLYWEFNFFTDSMSVSSFKPNEISEILRGKSSYGLLNLKDDVQDKVRLILSSDKNVFIRAIGQKGIKVKNGVEGKCKIPKFFYEENE